jgi:hypothetical protein
MKKMWRQIVWVHDPSVPTHWRRCVRYDNCLQPLHPEKELRALVKEIRAKQWDGGPPYFGTDRFRVTKHKLLPFIKTWEPSRGLYQQALYR